MRKDLIEINIELFSREIGAMWRHASTDKRIVYVFTGLREDSINKPILDASLI